jgi:hypothetical protein
MLRTKHVALECGALLVCLIGCNNTAAPTGKSVQAAASAGDVTAAPSGGATSAPSGGNTPIPAGTGGNPIATAGGTGGAGGPSGLATAGAPATPTPGTIDPVGVW